MCHRAKPAAFAVRRFCLLLLLLTLAGARAAAQPQLPPEGPRGMHCDWRPAEPGAVHWVLLPGWRVQPEWAWHWMEALQSALPATGSTGSTGSRCVFRGPQDARFQQRQDLDLEHATAELLARLPQGPVRLIAHSSGSFVAHRLLRLLSDAPGGAALVARIHYVNLDGAVGEGDLAMDFALLTRLASAQAVAAADAHGESANAAAMRALAALAPQHVTLTVLDGREAGCARAARWCLHMLPITRRPHRPEGFDLARDYGAIAPAHPVQVGYLRALPLSAAPPASAR